MRNEFEYDVFISFSHEDKEEVLPIYEKMTKFGLRAFFYEGIVKPGDTIPDKISKALSKSQHFILYCSKNTKKSAWIKIEWQTFLNSYNTRDPEHRLMFLFKSENCGDKDIPVILQSMEQLDSDDKLIQGLIKYILDNSDKKHKKSIAKLKEARQYYRHSRFWKPFAENQDIHIFTCARDVPHNPDLRRGFGGRTNIDKWDYRAVFDIMHFIANNYPSARVTIEDPMSKLQSGDFENKNIGSLTDYLASLRGMLADKDCIIIGSPDVSDFAELVLAQIHNIAPYYQERVKSKGFAIIKEEKDIRSSIYWVKDDTKKEKEGIVHIKNKDEYEPFKCESAKKERQSSKMYGILICANNPFCNEGTSRKISILSGFSGVATNGIAKLLTDESCLEEFFKLDEAYENITKNIEALIGVKHNVGKDFRVRDTRQIENFEEAITFEMLVEI